MIICVLNYSCYVCCYLSVLGAVCMDECIRVCRRMFVCYVGVHECVCVCLCVDVCIVNL